MLLRGRRSRRRLVGYLQDYLPFPLPLYLTKCIAVSLPMLTFLSALDVQFWRDQMPGF